MMILGAANILGLFLGMMPHCYETSVTGSCIVAIAEPTPDYIRGINGNQKFAILDLDRDGKAEGIAVLTAGDQQDQVLADIKVKFGKPTVSRTERMINGFGAKFDSLDADWIDEDKVVQFHGGGASFADGFIDLMSRARYDAKKLKEKSPGL